MSLAESIQLAHLGEVWSLRLCGAMGGKQKPVGTWRLNSDSKTASTLQTLKQDDLQPCITGFGVTHLKSLPYPAMTDWPPSAWEKRL